MPNAAVAAKHIASYQGHYATAQALDTAGDEWAAVCYFYAAFRAARAALYNDTRLDSDAAARAAHPRLNAGSRHVDFHNGYRTVGPGMNDVVRYLYPAIGSAYELLHTKSIEVRYLDGLVGVSIADVRGLADKVLAHLQSLNLL